MTAVTSVTGKSGAGASLAMASLYLICRELQRELRIPPLESHHGHVIKGSSSVGRAVDISA
jgi:hypothetical protein